LGGIKRDKVKPWLLAPVGISKYEEQDWAYTGVLGTIFKITKTVFERIVQLLKGVGHIVVQTIESVGDIASMAVTNLPKVIKYLPYILASGVVGIIGFQVYYHKQTNKFFGEDILKQRAGLSGYSNFWAIKLHFFFKLI
jgi:hypothetical protein